MYLLTDIDPGSESCPDPKTSWARWEVRGSLQRIADACFPKSSPLFFADEEGRKLSKEFPLVVWRQTAETSQLDLASGLSGWLPEKYGTLVLVAGSGREFRGHFDRTWHSGAGNLHVTILRRETTPVAHVRMGYAILPVLALHDCAQGIVTSNHAVRVKWINDILLNGAKIGGAISRGRIQGDHYTHEVFGMALNVHAAPPVPPTVFVPRIGSLAAHVGNKSLLDVLRQLLSAFASNDYVLRRKGIEGLLPRYREAADFLGREARLYEDGPGLDDTNVKDRRILARGRIEGVSDDLQLLIGGKTLGSGRLAYEEDCKAFGI